MYVYIYEIETILFIECTVYIYVRVSYTCFCIYHTYLHAYMCVMHIHIHVCIYIYVMHIYIHTCIDIYIYMYRKP